MSLPKTRVRVKIRKLGDSQFKLLLFDAESETIEGLIAKVRNKLNLPSSYSLMMLEGGGKVEDLQEIMFDDKIEITEEETNNQIA